MDYTCTCTEHVRLASGLTASAFPFFCGQGLKLRSIDSEDICLSTCYSILKNLHDWSYLCIIFITKLSLTCGGYSSCRCLSSTRFCAFILCWRKLSALFNIIMKTRSWWGTLVQHVKNNLCCILFCLFFSWLWTIAFINFVVKDNSGDETFAILYFLSVIGWDGKSKLLAEFI